MKLNRIAKYFLAAGTLVLCGCTEDSPVTNPPVDHTPTEIDRTGFVKGADVSWLTQMESEGAIFYNSADAETECMQLLRDECGVNAIRLRVWLNPSAGWNSVEDVVVKARRANELGLRLMIDFHFSDTWADPGTQETPAAWANLDLAGLQSAAAAHVTDMMTRLLALGIEPEWVQIGNETRNGFMYPLGSISTPANFAALVNSGYDAVKAIFPNAQVIVHIDSGNRWDLFTRLFAPLVEQGGKFDMIGLSLYPDVSDWQSMADNLLANAVQATAMWQKPVMICEIGMDYREAETCRDLLAYLRAEGEASGKIQGIFYWEPEATPGYNDGYTKGCFVDGKPTVALDAFKD